MNKAFSLLAFPFALMCCRAGAQEAIVPVPQGGMEARHAAKVAQAKAHTYGMLMVGDSITHNFEKKEYGPVWTEYFAKRDAFNLGYSGGRTENTLWNLTHGELENQHPKVVTLLIGTNDTDDANYPVVNSPERVFEGTKQIVELLRRRFPDAKILVLRIFPRTNVYRKPDGTERGSMAKRAAANLEAGDMTRALADDAHVFWLDINGKFLKPDGTIDPKLMPDLLHPSPAGAKIWADAMEPTLAKLFGDAPVK